MAFTYFLILWSTAWSPSRLCNSKERKQMELISQARLPLPQPSWLLERLRLCCADVWGGIQAPRAGKGAGGILGMLEPQRPGSQSPAKAVVPMALLPGRALAGHREEGLSKTVGGGERLFGSQQLLLTMENAPLALAGTVSTKERLKHHGAHHPIPMAQNQVRSVRVPSSPRSQRQDPPPADGDINPTNPCASCVLNHNNPTRMKVAFQPPQLMQGLTRGPQHHESPCRPCSGLELSPFPQLFLLVLP